MVRRGRSDNKTEVESAKRGLKNVRDQIKGLLENPDLTPEERAELEQLLREIEQELRTIAQALREFGTQP